MIDVEKLKELAEKAVTAINIPDWAGGLSRNEASAALADYKNAAHPQAVLELIAQNERMREALRPFAKTGELFEVPRQAAYDMVIYKPAAGEAYLLTGDHLRAARAALSET